MNASVEQRSERAAILEEESFEVDLMYPDNLERLVSHNMVPIELGA